MKVQRSRASPRLQFTDEERADAALQSPIAKVEKASVKLDAAERKIKAKKTLAVKNSMDANGIKSVQLCFEETKAKPPSKLHHPITRPVVNALQRNASAGNEDDNVGSTALLQSQRKVDSILQMGEHAYHAHKLKPHRKAKRSAKQLDKANVQYLHTKGRRDAPQLYSNPISRWQQKRHIKKEYAAMKPGKPTKGAPQTARGGTHAAKRSASAMEKTMEGVRRNPKPILLAALGALLLFILNTLSSCMPLAQTIVNSFVIGTYPATEEDVRAAERAYVSREKELADLMKHYEARHPGYDEYHISAQDIWHDPYALIAIISAYYDGEDWTIDDAYPVIEKYFNLQYILTEDVQRETRYRTEQRTGQHMITNPETGASHWESYQYDVQIPYTYTICTVTLENRDLSHMPVYSMSHHTMGLYALYMSTLGNMPDIFAGNPYASRLKDPLLYDIPEEVLKADAKFAMLMEEANRYIGYPYVWGGASPETSFDCSGFVSYVFTQSGVYNTGRLGATGLYGICRKIKTEDARPGDLVFFQGTMGDDVDGITHVGIYVGDNMMIHCGSPIGYANLNDSYWRNHFFAYGRVPY